MTSRPYRLLALHAAVIVVLCQPAAAQEVPALKNVQVLKGASRDQVIWAMGFIAQSLGVTCDYCHVRDGKALAFDRDDKKEKQTARRMLRMVKAIDEANFSGKQRVTCATCHNGGTKPRASNPVVDLETLRTRFAQRAAPAENTAAYPSASDLLAKYEQAIGGPATLANLKTMIEKFTIVDPTGTGSGETIRKAPDKWSDRTERAPGRTITWVCDGPSARITSPRSTRRVTGLDLDDIKFTANFWRTLKLTDRYSTAATIAKETLNDRPVYVVEGEVKGSGIKERLFLDADSGLLLRRQTYKPTLLGFLADQADFLDYRTSDGIKVPFVVKTETGAFATTRTYSAIRFNVAVDDATFSTAEETVKP